MRSWWCLRIAVRSGRACVKQYAQWTDNTLQFEKSILSRVLLDHTRTLQDNP